MFYEITIAGIKRRLELFPVNEDLYIAGFVIFGDVELTIEASKALLAQAPEFDAIVTAESKGITLAYEMARQSGNKDFVVARKEQKLYMSNVIRTKVDSITTDHVQKLVLGENEVALLTGKKVLIVDDVVSTGGSLKSLEKLISQIDCEVVGKMTILAEGDSIGREDVIYLAELPLFDKNGNPLK
jgi:adenine phosphoribosyltransferase